MLVIHSLIDEDLFDGNKEYKIEPSALVRALCFAAT